MKKTYGLIILALFNILVFLLFGQVFHYESFSFNFKLIVSLVVGLLLIYTDLQIIRLLTKRVKKDLPEKKKKFAVKKLRRKKHIANLSLSILCILLALGNYFYHQASEMLFVITSSMEASNLHYSCYVTKDSEITSLKDESIINIGFDGKQNSLLSETLSSLYERDCYVDYQPNYIISSNELYGKLQRNDIDAMIIDDKTLETLKTNHPDFEENTRLLETLTIPTSVESKPVNVKKEPFNVLIMGVDIREDEGDIHSRTRTDTLMVATFNPETMQLSLVSIPRDSLVELGNPSKGEEDKITHAGLEGIGCSVETVENLLDIEINYYAKFNFNALVQLVDALEGVDVDVQYSFTEQDSHDVPDAISVSAGMQNLNGEEALAYARHRKTQNDHVRSSSQQQVLKAILSKMASVDVLSHLDNLFKVMKDNMTTNFNREEIMKLAMLMPQLNELQLSNMVIAGEDLEAYVARYDQVIWITELDEASIQEAKEMIASTQK